MRNQSLQTCWDVQSLLSTSESIQSTGYHISPCALTWLVVQLIQVLYMQYKYAYVDCYVVPGYSAAAFALISFFSIWWGTFHFEFSKSLVFFFFLGKAILSIKMLIQKVFALEFYCSCLCNFLKLKKKRIRRI